MITAKDRAAILALWSPVVILAAIEAAFWSGGEITLRPLLLALAVWGLIVALAVIATRGFTQLRTALTQVETAHRATKHEVAKLHLHNEMLEILAKSVDVPLAFQGLSRRVADLVPCDRVGLALLAGQDEFQTYTARVNEVERRSRPRPEVVFKAEGTAIGQAVRVREPLILNDTAEAAGDFLDINVLHSSGFGSAMIIPLVAQDVAVGTLNAVSRKKGAFSRAHVDALLPVSEIFAVGHVAQRLQVAVTRQHAIRSMTELTVGVASEINGALQTIAGHCDLIERSYPDPNLHRDLATVVLQAQRISALLEKMRQAANDQVTEAADDVQQVSPAAGA